MRTSETVNELAAALSKAQSEMGAVPKRGTGQVGQQHTSYATFDDLVATVRKPLADNGLSYMQMLDEGPSLTTMLLHASGQWIASSTPVDAMEANRGTNAMQALGSTLTYLKRYALAAMLGVASDEDDDGSTSRYGNGRKPAHVQTATQTPPPPDEPLDAWDAEEQAGEQSFVADTVKVLTTKKGAPYLMFTAGDEAASWFKGRDEMLSAAPWIGQTYTKDDFKPGVALPLRIRVEYEVNGQYRNAVAFAQA